MQDYERTGTSEVVASERRTYRFFEVSLLLKGANAVLELVGGALALFVSPVFVQNVTAYFTNEELGQDPHDFVAVHLVRWADAYAVGAHQEFIAAYLLVHGVVKMALVVALLAGAVWAFPVAIAIFGLFALYQCYLLLAHYTLGMLVLTVFDLVVIYFVFREWRVVEAHRAS
ncbi:MAG: DUF2127 domain-containing protein [Patescibacteria group bacterium]|nr:DUF2127 domain-containing protein [Patescibacteria group bacterium]MDE1944864.1 DUF2127 domain-containing protein [Patescibacteria group bacterium]MDE2057310.1 DUF2127 domain-containing protein [Patescibacteria group bacterium]